jgi:TonB family protein
MEVNRDSKSLRGAVTTATASATGGSSLDINGYSDDLARFCLRPDRAETNRALAWVNSVCLAFLMIGIVGLHPIPPAVNRRALAAEEAVPTVIEPVITPTQQVSPDSGPTEAPSETSASDIVAVTVDSPAVAFSVPTVGNLLVPQGMAQAPPAHPMQGAMPISSVKIEHINTTGAGGRRPAPMYPYESLRDKEQGTVVLLIEVDESGKPASVTVKESSGYARLDRTAADWVKRYWFFGQASSRRMYESPIVFQLQ